MRPAVGKAIAAYLVAIFLLPSGGSALLAAEASDSNGSGLPAADEDSGAAPPKIIYRGIGGLTDEEKKNPPQNLPRTHDRGLYVRLSSGIGNVKDDYTTYRYESRSNGDTLVWVPVGREDVHFNETGVNGGSAIGFMLRKDLAFHLTTASWSSNNNFVSDGMLGIGLTAYPFWGTLFSGSVGLSGGNPVLEILLGKEWWISNRWTLGATAVFDGISLESYRGSSSNALRFIATYN